MRSFLAWPHCRRGRQSRLLEERRTDGRDGIDVKCGSEVGAEIGSSETDTNGSGERGEENGTELVLVEGTVCLVLVFEHTATNRLLHLPSVERDWQSVAGAGISTNRCEGLGLVPPGSEDR